MAFINFEKLSISIFATVSILFLTCVTGLPAASGQESEKSHSSAVSQSAKDASKDQIELLGVVSIEGDAQDFSGLQEVWEGGCRANQLGGFSGVASAEQPGQFLFLSDRGPRDGAVDWTCRFHRAQLHVTPDSEHPVSLVWSQTVLLKDERGRLMTGLASAFAASRERSRRFDPEGIRVMRNGHVLISDEYGPRLAEFDQEGRLTRDFQVPDRYQIEHPGLGKKDENPKNEKGRATNRGMEGLALVPSEKFVYGLMQSPLLQDSNRENPAKPSGLHCRMIEFSMDGNARREFVYRLDSKSNKLNELLAVDEHTFVAIERDGEAGTEARFKKLMLLELDGATDVSGVDRLSPQELGDEIRPVKKQVLIDLLDPQWGLFGANMPEKIEGLAFGETLPDGRRTLVVVSDNDFEPQNPSWVYVFAVPDSALVWSDARGASVTAGQ